MTRARRADKVARRDARWREQAARLIDAAHVYDIVVRYDYIRSRRRDREAGHDPSFDVGRVRAYCERLIAEADALDMQREVFADWTRAQGMGPEDRARFPTRYRRFAVTPWGESETSIDVWHRGGDVWRIEVQPSSLRGAFVTARTMRTPMVERWRLVGGVLEIVAVDVRVSPDNHKSVAIFCIDGVPSLGGWPGNLAREYVSEERARRKCSRRDCDGGVLVGSFLDHLGRLGTAGNTFGGAAFTVTEKDGVMRVACPECEAFAETRTSRAFVNGGNRRRAAQRLLDTLDGRCPWNPYAPAQPNECSVCSGRGETGPEWTAPAGAAIRIVIQPGVQVVGADGQPREAAIGEHVSGPCADCNGTGHNLRGTLPPLPVETVQALSMRSWLLDGAAIRREE